MPITVSICACSVQPDYLSKGARRSKATASAQGRRRRRRARRPNNTSFFFPAPVLPRPLSRVSPGPSPVRNHHHMFSPPPASLLTPQQCFSFLHAGVFSLVSSRPGTSAKTPGLFHCPRQAENGKRVTLPGKKTDLGAVPPVTWPGCWLGPDTLFRPRLVRRTRKVV